MKIIKTNKLLLGAVVLVSSVGTAQTVNTGELAIKPSTIMSVVDELDNTATGDLINDGELYMYSHYNNDGIVSFTPGTKTGITRMRGLKGYQDISGSVPMDWNNVEWNNTKAQPAFHLSNEVRIFGKADFKQGIVDDDNYNGLVVFESMASHINVADASHVDGYVRKNGNEAFLFPIGDGGQYRYAGISAPGNAGDAFTGKYFLEDSNTLYPHSNKAGVIKEIDDKEYWTVDKTAGNDNIFLTLSWDEDTTPSNIYGTPYDEIHIVRWDAAQNLWVDEGGAANPDTKEVTMVIDPLKEYGVFTLARVKVEDILPCGGKGVVVYNAVSPNDDGLNDYFNIEGIQNCTNNTVEIYNRWGVKVYETKAYNTNGNVFRGFSEGRVTINKNEKLPDGTYFYIINFLDGASGKNSKKAGYLYINN
jgi:gliding motility-associated-like protein